MGVTWTHVMGWNPDGLSSAASRLRTQASQVTRLASQFTNETDLKRAWTGQASEVAKQSADYLATDIRWMSESMAGCANATAAAAKQIDRIQNALRAKRSAIYATDLLRIDSEGHVSAKYPQVDPADLEAMVRAEAIFKDAEAAARRMQQQIDDLLSEAEAVDKTLGRALQVATQRTNGSAGEWISNHGAVLRYGMSPKVKDALAAAAALGALADKESKYGSDAPIFLRLPYSAARASAFKTFFEALQSLDEAELTNFFEELPYEVGQKLSSSMKSMRQLDQSKESDPKKPSLEELAFTSYVAKNVDLGVWRTASSKMSFLEPYISDQTPLGNSRYVFGDVTPILEQDGKELIFDPARDVNQGGVGDCAFLAALISASVRHPEILRNNLVRNPNGSVTVTLYRDNKPVPVTVAMTMPKVIEPDEARLLYGKTAFLGDSTANWATIYEKAFAQLEGGYGKIEPTDVGRAMRAVMGPRVETKEAVWMPEVSVNQLAQTVRSGGVVTVGTIDISPEKLALMKKHQLVQTHAYAVLNVDVGANKVLIQNPWGREAGLPQYVTLTMDEMKALNLGVWIGEKK